MASALALPFLPACTTTEHGQLETSAREQVFTDYFLALRNAIETEFVQEDRRNSIYEGINIEYRDMYLDLYIDGKGLLYLREDAVNKAIKDKPNLMRILVQALAHYNESPLLPPTGYLKENDLIEHRLDISFLRF